jgi:hypothetical protein
MKPSTMTKYANQITPAIRGFAFFNALKIADSRIFNALKIWVSMRPRIREGQAMQPTK